MEIEIIREKLHRFINSIEDKKAEAMYALFADEIEYEESDYTDEFKAELDRRYEYYEQGGEMISAEEANRQIAALLQARKRV